MSGRICRNAEERIHSGMEVNFNYYGEQYGSRTNATTTEDYHDDAFGEFTIVNASMNKRLDEALRHQRNQTVAIIIGYFRFVRAMDSKKVRNPLFIYLGFRTISDFFGV